MDTEGDLTLESWTGFPINEIDGDGDKPDSTMANASKAMEVFKQFDVDQRGGNVQELVAAFNLAGSTDVKVHCESTCF